MPLSSLLLARDLGIESMLRRVLQEFRIGLQFTAQVEEAASLLTRRKFDGFFVDFDQPGSTALLRRLRDGQSNRSCIVFALISDLAQRRHAFELGGNFVLEKPLSAERTLRSIRAGHGLMVRERRRYFRCAVDLPVTLESAHGVLQNVTALNLSEGGLALRAARKLPVGSVVRLSFTLPGSHTPIEAKGEVAWSAEDGSAGVRLVSMRETARHLLLSWTTRIVEDRDPPPAVFANPRSGVRRNPA